MDSIILDAPQKQCNACLEFLPATPQFFFRARLGLYGVRSVCKKCEKAGRPITKPKLPDGHKRCFKCKQILPHECFSKGTKNKDGLQRHCKVCERAYGRQVMTPEKKRAKALRRYHITLEQYDQMLMVQNGVCKCCGQPETRMNPLTGELTPLAIDHEHTTGRVRALLCHGCNVAFGSLKEDIERIRALLIYAEWCQTRLA